MVESWCSGQGQTFVISILSPTLSAPGLSCPLFNNGQGGADLKKKTKADRLKQKMGDLGTLKETAQAILNT